MKITWDSEAEGIYIDLLCDKGEHSHTVEITDDILIDYNKQGDPTGIEILNVTKPEIEDVTRKQGGIMDKLQDTLDWFFKGAVKVKVDEERERLELTYGSITLTLTIPQVIGAQGEGSK